MRKRGIGLIVGACLLPASLAMAFFGTTRMSMWIMLTGGATGVLTVEVPNNNGDGSEFWFCGVTGPCSRLCASCHTGGQDRSKELYTVERHEKGHYPRLTVMPVAGQRLSYGNDGGYLISNAGRFEYFTKGGTLSLTSPTGSTLLKDAAGVPLVLWMPGPPALPPKPR